MRKRKLPPPPSPSATPITRLEDSASTDTFRVPLSASTASDAKPKKSKVDETVLTKVKHAATRKQRHFILREFIAAINDDDEVVSYMTAVEQRVYDALLAEPMHVSFNMYRGELYRDQCFALLAAIRKDGPYLMSRYEPTLLAALPPHLIVNGTETGAEYKAWKDREERMRLLEHEQREARANEKGEGWLKCHRCGGAFETSMVQMRGADEPATVFMTCKNCGLTKRKG